MFVEHYEKTGGKQPETRSTVNKLTDSVVELKISHRFDDQKGIGKLKTAVNVSINFKLPNIQQTVFLLVPESVKFMYS